jgi:hypothetical protein
MAFFTSDNEQERTKGKGIPKYVLIVESMLSKKRLFVSIVEDPLILVIQILILNEIERINLWQHFLKK